MTTKGAKGAMIAAAVAGFLTTAAPMMASAKDAGVHCQGVNACKGKGGCKGADNGCKGQNGCKGKGWVSMSDKDCTTKGGTVMPAAPDKK